MPLDDSAKEVIRKYAIKNAMDYGKASEASVLGKALSRIPGAKSVLGEIRSEVSKAVDEVNGLAAAELEREYARYRTEFEAEREAKTSATAAPRMELAGAVKGNFATRYAPAPNGYMHVGHAKSVFLAKEFARMYEGRCFLYFDDTNPEKDKQEYVDAIKRDLSWLGAAFDGEYYASDSMDFIYDCSRKLLLAGRAYICRCAQEEIKRNRIAGKECADRSAPYDANLFEELVRGDHVESYAVVRFKGDMHSDNTALRDPTIMRIKKRAHYRQGAKYALWPTYDLNTPINDSIHGVTDALRSKEYELRDALDLEILGALGLRKPRIHSHARLAIRNNITHKRELNRLIREGELLGWDDPRLVTIAALRNRGVQPAAIREFVLSAGMSKVDSSVDISALLAINKRYIDPIAKRLYYVHEPVRLHVEGISGRKVEIPLHPSGELGSRSYNVGDAFYISGDDAKGLKAGDRIRLKGLCDIAVAGTGDSIEAGLSPDSSPGRIVQWVTESDRIDCKVIIPEAPLGDDGNFKPDSLKVSSGYVESYASSLKDGDVVQLERFGFCIVHDIAKMEFVFTSK